MYDCATGYANGRVWSLIPWFRQHPKMPSSATSIWVLPEATGLRPFRCGIKNQWWMHEWIETQVMTVPDQLCSIGPIDGNNEFVFDACEPPVSSINLLFRLMQNGRTTMQIQTVHASMMPMVVLPNRRLRVGCEGSMWYRSLLLSLSSIVLGFIHKNEWLNLQHGMPHS